MSLASFSPSKTFAIAVSHRFAPRRLEAFFYQLLAHAVNHRRTGVERFHDLAVAPARASWRISAFNKIRFQLLLRELVPLLIRSRSRPRSPRSASQHIFFTDISFCDHARLPHQARKANRESFNLIVLGD